MLGPFYAKGRGECVAMNLSRKGSGKSDSFPDKMEFHDPLP